MAMDLNSEIAAKFECIICICYMRPPIRMCTTGHNLCDSCFHIVNKCPLCKGHKVFTRNFPLEAIHDKLTFRCNFNDLGCDVQQLGAKIVLHEKSCSFRPASVETGCPFGPECEWVGNRYNLSDHLLHTESHTVKQLDAAELQYLDNWTDNNNIWKYVYTAFGNYFILVIEKSVASVGVDVVSFFDTKVDYTFKIDILSCTNLKIMGAVGKCITFQEFTTDNASDKAVGFPIHILDQQAACNYSLVYKFDIYQNERFFQRGVY